MRSLYIDCDGVIFDTIKLGFQEMKEKNVDLSNENAITEYFKHADWEYLIHEGGPINNSIEKIKILIDSKEFLDVSVATHRCSYNEGIIKSKKFHDLIPNLKVITIPKKIEKHYALSANGNILIDDSRKKTLAWINDGGIGVLFTDKVDHLICPYEQDNPYYITNDLLDLLIVNKLEKEKTYSLK